MYMSNIKISHEVPLCLLEDSLEFNHYDYCLCHLLDQNIHYKDFFFNSSKVLKRKVYLDNSLHELGQPYPKDRLLYYLKELQPSHFFVADYWEDMDKSIVSAKEWIALQSQFPNTTFIAVVQAKDYGQAAQCYQIYKDLGYKMVAFSYGADYYKDFTPHPNINLAKALGRLHVISSLYKSNIIKITDEIHLLGTSYPGEGIWYEDFPFIKSWDTSNPVMAALEGTKYRNWGLNQKPYSNMNNSFNKKPINFSNSLVYFNVNHFKRINNLCS